MSIWNDPDVFSPTDETQTAKQPFSINDKLTIDQVVTIAPALWKLHDKVNKNLDTSAPVQWPEWNGFITLAYENGFVCRDVSDLKDDVDRTTIYDFIEQLKRDQDQVDELTLREIRQVIHYIVRSERWGDGGGPNGAGTLYSFITSGLADRFGNRLA